MLLLKAKGIDVNNESYFFKNKFTRKDPLGRCNKEFSFFAIDWTGQ